MARNAKIFGYSLAFHAIKKTADLLEKSAVFVGTPGGIRTHGLQSRSLTRYPAALRARIAFQGLESLSQPVFLVNFSREASVHLTAND